VTAGPAGTRITAGPAKTRRGSAAAGARISTHTATTTIAAVLTGCPGRRAVSAVIARTAITTRAAVAAWSIGARNGA
jgi:hypothetical protein